MSKTFRHPVAADRRVRTFGAVRRRFSRGTRFANAPRMSNVAAFSMLLLGSFGAEGTVVPSGAIVLSHTSFPEGAGSFTNVSLAPEISYFLIENLAVGAGLSFGFGAGPGQVSYSYGAHPTVGYYFPISETLGIFPRLGLEYWSSKFSHSVPGIGAPLEWSSSATVITIDAAAPVLFHHGSFFIGFGPSFSKRLAGRQESRGETTILRSSPYNIALASTFGGWW